MDTFNKLYGVDVTPHIEKKNNLSYLSWAWAWAELKKNYPTATRTVYEDENNRPYFDDGKTCWVKVGIVVDGLECIDYLPIMDFKNKSISVDAVTSMDVNKAIQRSTVKAIALHGLGLYIYAGEDMPESPTLTIEQMDEIKRDFSQSHILYACQMIRVGSMANVKSSDYSAFVQYCNDAHYQEQLHTIRKRIGEALVALNNPMEAKNSVKKHLGVDSTKDCFDLEKLNEFYNHTVEKITNKKEEVSSEAND